MSANVIYWPFDLSVLDKILYNNKMQIIRRAILPILFSLFLTGGSFIFCFLKIESKDIKIKDSLLREVSIPLKVERVLSLQPEITRIIISLGGGESLVGIDYFLPRFDILSKIVFPPIEHLPVVSTSNESVNIEMAVQLKPDVIFASPSESQITEVLERKTSMPVVALSSMGSFDKLLKEIKIVGDVIGRSKRASELVHYFNETIGTVQNSVKEIPHEERPKVYLAFWSSLTKTPISYEPVTIAGGINLADNLLPSYLGTVGTAINIEQIVKWNPDLILIHGNYLPQERVPTVEQVLNDPRLDSVQAVKDKKVYYTYGFWYWWDPAQVLIETLYLARLFYPERFGSLNLEIKGNAIFKKFYGIGDGFGQLCRILKCHEWTTE